MKQCPCGKVHGATREDAREKYEMASQHNGLYNPVRFYACQFGGWHWTQRLDDTPWRDGARVREASQEDATVTGQVMQRPAA